MKFVDRIKQETTSTGTGNLTLSSTPIGFRQFASVYTLTQRFLYVVQDTATGQWEIGMGYVQVNELVRETPLEGSSATPVSFGSGTKQVFVAHPGMLSAAAHLMLFGDGSDGGVVISSGTTTLSRDMDYQDLTINGSGKLKTNGYRVRVRGVLDLSNAGSDAIHMNGNDGSSANVNVGGAAGAITWSGIGATLGYGTAGTAGPNGGTAAGTASTAGTTDPPSNGGASGNTSSAGSGSGGGGGAGAGSTVGGSISKHRAHEPLVAALGNGNATFVRGGMGGPGGPSGGGDGTAGGGGGGGASGGGVVDIAAACLKVSPTNTTAGAISARGGAGGNGGTPAGGNRGGGSGGAGGGGGHIRLVVGYVVGAKAQLCSAQGGNGGNGGSLTGTGFNGSGGGGGTGGIVDVFKMAAGTRVRTLGTSGGANTGQVGGSGGASYGDV